MDYIEAIKVIMDENKELEAIGSLCRSALTKKNLDEIHTSDYINRLYRIQEYNAENINDETINKLTKAPTISL